MLDVTGLDARDVFYHTHICDHPTRMCVVIHTLLNQSVGSPIELPRGNMSH